MEAAGTGEEGPGKRTKSPLLGVYLEHGMMRVRRQDVDGRDQDLTKDQTQRPGLQTTCFPGPLWRCTRHRAFQTSHQTHSNAGLMQKQSAHGTRLKEHRLPLLKECTLGLLSVSQLSTGKLCQGVWTACEVPARHPLQ